MDKSAIEEVYQLIKRVELTFEEKKFLEGKIKWLKRKAYKPKWRKQNPEKEREHGRRGDIKRRHSPALQEYMRKYMEKYQKKE